MKTNTATIFYGTLVYYDRYDNMVILPKAYGYKQGDGITIFHRGKVSEIESEVAKALRFRRNRENFRQERLDEAAYREEVEYEKYEQREKYGW